MTRLQNSLATVVFAILIGFATAALGQNEPDGGGCNLASLKGDYLMTARAENIDQGINVFVGVQTFDGEGNHTIRQTASRNGVIESWHLIVGKYTVEPDCTGALTLGTSRWNLVITRDGKEGAYIRIDDGTIATRSINRR